MSLDKLDTVDAVGIETSTGCVVLTIADSWDWSDETGHLLALQSKLNSYFDFIDSGQLFESYPNAIGRAIVIDIVTRYPLPTAGLTFVENIKESIPDLDVQVSSRCIPGVVV